MSKAGLMARVTVAENVKSARLAAGLTQSQLAEKLGLPSPASGIVSRWEGAANQLTVSRLAEIAEALGVPVSSLVAGL